LFCSSELLATYADDVLRKGGLQLEEAQVDKTLDSIVRLFSYLIDKDLFAEFYRKQLATRLLTQRSASSDAEKSMIGKLKLLMGAQFTSKLEGMFNDMRNAAEHLVDFQNFVQQRHMNLEGIEFTVQTLTTGFWPSYLMDELKLPSVMQNCIDCFRVYYDTRTSNRKLRWIHDLGVVTLGANFTKRRLDLVVSTVQATLLLQFNDTDELTIDQLLQYTGLTADVMKQTLKSLVSGKFKLLVKSPAEGYSTAHKMRVNHAFQSAQFRVRIPNAIRKTTSKDRENASSAVHEDRKHAMEANIVRIMKARKVMNHVQLMTEVRTTTRHTKHTRIRVRTLVMPRVVAACVLMVCCWCSSSSLQVSQQLMSFFQPDPRAIKQRIEDLIQREYMKRDDEQSNVYHYLA
jgi:cullin 1